jgi:dipeptidyl aminopeptidase/acylaminoacyl peptidase
VTRLAAVLLLLTVACSHPEAQQPAPSGPVRVSVDTDGATLVGDIYMPAQRPRGGVPGVAVVHGSGRTTRNMHRYIVGPLNDMGVAVLVYDKRGVGESTGTFSNVGTADSVQSLGQLAADASRMAKVLAAHRGVDPKRVGLIGASQAGWIMPIAAARNTGISFLVIISGPAVSVGYEILHGRLTNELNPSAATVPPEEAERRLKAFNGPHGYDPAPTLAALKTPTLWLMGGKDINLPLKETLEALKALPQTSSGVLTLIEYPDGDHSLSRPDRSRVPYWDDVRAWLQRRGLLSKS